MNNHDDLLNILHMIDPAKCSYEEWLHVGMALQNSGFQVTEWESWSARDHARYHKGECAQKWLSFRGSPNPITSGTIVELAERYGGYAREMPRALGWDEEFIADSHDLRVIDQRWIQNEDLPGPGDFDPAQQIREYINTLFMPDEYVGYVVTTWEKQEEDGSIRYLPDKGSYKRTAEDILRDLDRYNGDLSQALGDYKEEAGAWVRFNPLDGAGIRDENVTDYRYALIECDNMELNRQYTLIKQLELPVAVLVHSGKKSLHAIVHVDADSLKEYKSRVDYIYKVCEANGLTLDKQNRNPSRLSRFPGFMRAGHPQYIVAKGIGQPDFAAWKEYIESSNDDLPEIDCLDAWFDHPPELAPQLICGVLRQGHKMLLSGPSKAGKSFALIELCIAIAEGQPWIGFPCAQGSVLYVNLELDEKSCIRRFVDVYKAMGLKGTYRSNIDIWNLRGKSEPMDKLAPKLIRRAQKKDYAAIIIDPIYKIITGDENSADQMAQFCNQFDKVATELGCSVIYCHHHSKGQQGQKRSADRSSGSGVFARDPDAILDMIQIQVKDEQYAREKARKRAELCLYFIKQYRFFSWMEDLDGVALEDPVDMFEAAKRLLKPEVFAVLLQRIQEAENAIEQRTAWRIEGTLREFPAFEPRQLWFDYPIHMVDGSSILARAKPMNYEKTSQEKGLEAMHKANKKKQEEAIEAFRAAIASTDGSAKEVYAFFPELNESTVRRRAYKAGYKLEKGHFIPDESECAQEQF